MLAVAEHDPALYSTWVEEVRARNEADARFAQWSNTHELLSAIGTLVSGLNRTVVAVNSKRGARLPDVWKPHRPGEDRRPAAVSPRDMARMHLRR